MRLVVIILNVVLIGIVLYFVSEDSNLNGRDIAIAAFFLLTPIIILATLYFNNSES